MRTKYILFFLFLFSLNFVIASTCPDGVYPCDESVQFNNPITTSSSSTDYSILNVNNSLYWQGHTGTDGSWLTGISGSGNPFNQSLNTTDSVNFNSINISMDATQRQAIVVDGATNDWNGTYTGNTLYVNDFSRDYNVGNERPENIALIKSTLNIKHTNANLSGAFPYNYGMSFQVNENGNRTNWNGSSSTVNVYGIQGTLLPAQYLDTKSTGGIIYQQYGISSLISSSERLFDTGGLNPTHALYSYGSYNQIISNPIDIGNTWTINNYGQYISVTGNKNGTSTNYGLYIATTSGADSNYGLYDATTTDWIKSGGDIRIMRSDTAKLVMGAGEDAKIWYNGTDMIINPKVVGTGSLIINGSQVINQNLTVNNLLTLNVVTLPTCINRINGTIARNETKLYYCDGTEWNALY